MVSWWGRDSYSNNELIQTSDAVIINSAYGSSVSLGSRVRSKYILNNTFTDIIVIYIQNQHQYMDQFINMI